MTVYIYVGIISDKQQLIYAHDEVRIDQLDHYGIYNQQRKRYSKTLRLVKPLLPAK